MEKLIQELAKKHNLTLDEAIKLSEAGLNVLKDMAKNV